MSRFPSLRHRLFLTMVLCLQFASTYAAGWEVNEAPPKSVQLDKGMGLLFRTYDDYYGDGNWDFTLYEFTKSNPVASSHSQIIDTTGNSITFRIPKAQIIGSSVRGPGDTARIPVSFAYIDRKLVSGGERSPSISFETFGLNSVEVIFESSRQANAPRSLPSPLPYKGIKDEQILDALKNRKQTRKLFGASYTGQKYCGYDVMRLSEFEIPNPILKKMQKPPMTYGNLLVSTAGERVTRKILCEPTKRFPTCHTTDYFFEWLQVRVSFRGNAICDVDTLMSLLKAWAADHIISQTIPTKSK